MNRQRFPRLAALATSLFEKPVSRNYLTLSVLLIFGGATVIYSDSKLPEIAKHVVMVGTMVGIARLFNPTPMRWAWAAIVSLISLVLLLEVSLYLMQSGARR